MFLAKKNGGVYHFFFTDDSDRRHSRSTGARTEAEALKFVRTYNVEQDARRRALQHITPEEFRKLYMIHSCGVNTPKTAASNRSALNELCRFVGAGTILSKITTADCERFLAKETVDA